MFAVVLFVAGLFRNLMSDFLPFRLDFAAPLRASSMLWGIVIRCFIAFLLDTYYDLLAMPSCSNLFFPFRIEVCARGTA